MFYKLVPFRNSKTLALFARTWSKEIAWNWQKRHTIQIAASAKYAAKQWGENTMFIRGFPFAKSTSRYVDWSFSINLFHSHFFFLRRTAQKDALCATRWSLGRISTSVTKSCAKNITKPSAKSVQDVEMKSADQRLFVSRVDASTLHVSHALSAIKGWRMSPLSLTTRWTFTAKRTTTWRRQSGARTARSPSHPSPVKRQFQD